MVITQKNLIRPAANLTVTWEKLPSDFQLEEEPVENTGQPLIAGALAKQLSKRWNLRNASDMAAIKHI